MRKYKSLVLLLLVSSLISPCLINHGQAPPDLRICLGCLRLFDKGESLFELLDQKEQQERFERMMRIPQ